VCEAVQVHSPCIIVVDMKPAHVFSHVMPSQSDKGIAIWVGYRCHDNSGVVVEAAFCREVPLADTSVGGLPRCP
jgi:hypothetical protein